MADDSKAQAAKRKADALRKNLRRRKSADHKDSAPSAPEGQQTPSKGESTP